MVDFWDSRYSEEDFIYGTKPNDFLIESIKNHKPGKILFPCEGEGRNAVYAATLGWDVAAFDFSRLAMIKAMKLSQMKNVKIDYHFDSIQTFNSLEKFDLICTIFAHFPKDERKYFLDKMMKLLCENGIFIAEYFSKNQFGMKSGGPQNMDMLYSIEELKDDFKDYQIIKLTEQQRFLNEGNYHQGSAHVIRLEVKK